LTEFFFISVARFLFIVVLHNVTVVVMVMFA